MLDRMAVLVPGFREDDPVDLTTTLVEALAYRADQQSYTIDWVGTEAFLDTARTRVSVTRHARLLDYTPGEGASARTFVAVSLEPPGTAGDGYELRASTPVLPRSPALPPSSRRRPIRRRWRRRRPSSRRSLPSGYGNGATRSPCTPGGTNGARCPPGRPR